MLDLICTDGKKMQMNNYVIRAWDMNFNCLVRAFETFNEYQNAIRYLNNHIDLELIIAYNPRHKLIYFKSYNDGGC